MPCKDCVLYDHAIQGIYWSSRGGLQVKKVLVECGVQYLNFVANTKEVTC